MEDIKEKLLTAVQDGAIDAGAVVETLLLYIDEDTVQDIIDKEGWDEACGIGLSDESEDDFQSNCKQNFTNLGVFWVAKIPLFYYIIY